MRDVLISQVRLVEKYKQAIPELERMLEHDTYYYVAGSLILNIPDPSSGLPFMEINIKPLSDYASETIRKGQYLASQIFVKHKKETCYSYKQAQENIEIYEKRFTGAASLGDMLNAIEENW